VALKPETTVAYLNGELDMSTARRLTIRLGPLAKAGSDIIVNLSGVRYMGSAGQRALRELQRDATAAGGSVKPDRRA
jgi:anti-anti-sigma factor